MKKECPICGRPITLPDLVLAESGGSYQCHHCWSRVNATRPFESEIRRPRRPRLPAARRTTQARRRVR